MKKTVAFLLFAFVLQQSEAQIWTSGTPMPEIVRAGNTATYATNGENYLYVVSGRNANGVINNKNYRYQLSTDSWTELSNHPTGILSCGTVILKDSLYTIGGVVTTPGASTKKVYKYSINENTWSQVADHPVAIIDTEAVAYQDSLIYVVGGYSSGKVRVYNSQKNTWRNATSIMPLGQSISWGSLSVRNDTLVYMCGARNFLSTNYFNTVRIGVIDQSNRANINWTLASPFPGQTRTFFDTYPWQEGLIMTGGSTDNTFETSSGECYYYEVGADSWTQLASKPTPWVTGNSGSFLVGDEWKLVCTAGYNNGYIDPTEIFSSPLLSNNSFKNNASLVITPNPAQEILNIQIQEKIKEIAVYDMLGKKVTVNQLSTNSLDVSNLANGIYSIKVLSDNDTTFDEKFVKN